MNLAYHYPKIFWNTACLTINAGADEDVEDSKTTQYGKIAKAIGAIQSQGQKMGLPDINKAKFSFSPDLETQEIIFSLKGISGVGDEAARAIVDNKPYTSLADFCEKMKRYKEAEAGNKYSDSTTIMLIKAGCFDALENKPREQIMQEFLKSITPLKDSLTTRDILMLDQFGLLTDAQKRYEKQLYRFKIAVCDKANFVKATGKTPSTFFYRLNSNNATDFFYRHFADSMTEGKDYECSDAVIVKKGSLDKVFDKLMQPFKESVLQNPLILEAVNNQKISKELAEKATGSISQWEMESLCFYYHEHELAHVNKELYSMSVFDTLPETPVVVEYRKYGNREFPRFQLTRICGTVLDKNKNKHIVSILTDSGVVDVKFYKGQYGFYDRQLSEIDEDGHKTVLEKSWFTRGNKLLVTGMRRGDQFVPRKYSDSAYRHTVQKIIEVNEDGTLRLQSERVGFEDERESN